jgi:hypothetical protein
MAAAKKQQQEAASAASSAEDPLALDLKQPDAALGLLLWEWWRRACYNRATDEDARDTILMEKRVRLDAFALDFVDPGNAILEKAIRLAAAEDFERAGRHARYYLVQGGVLAAAIDEAASGRRRQRANASRPRPKKADTHRALTVAEMRKARADGLALQAFIEAATTGSVIGLTISAANVRGVTRYDVSCEGLEKDERVSMATLSTWWAAAGAPAS